MLYLITFRFAGSLFYNCCPQSTLELLGSRYAVLEAVVLLCACYTACSLVPCTRAGAPVHTGCGAAGVWLTTTGRCV